MLSIIDHRIPEKAKESLSKYFELIELPSSTETYESISAHPDIFFCKTNDALIYAPNIDNNIINILEKKGVSLIKGKSSIGKKYPESAYYNALITENHLIHNIKFTDPSILGITAGLEQIKVNQGYTRCNLIGLSENLFLTSDLGIHQILLEQKLNSFFINPEKIHLSGFKNGFFGGCCGFYENRLFVLGSLKYITEQDELKKNLEKNNIEIVELFNGPLFDGGSIIII